MQHFCLYLQCKHNMTSVWFPVHISTFLSFPPVKSPPFSNTHRWLLTGSALLLLTPQTGQGAALKVVQPLFPLLPPFSSCWAELHVAHRKSQSGHFDDVNPSRACCGLDAGCCRESWRGRRPPLWGPVEAVAVRGQSWGCWEADYRRGDPAAAFAVDPAAVISFQVEVGATEGKRGKSVGAFLSFYADTFQVYVLSQNRSSSNSPKLRSGQRVMFKIKMYFSSMRKYIKYH